MKRQTLLRLTMMVLMAIAAEQVQAATIRVDFSGTINYAYFGPSFPIQVGIPFSGTLEYPVPLPDLNADPGYGVYDFSAGSLSWTIGAHTFQNSPSMIAWSQGDETGRTFIVQSYTPALPAGWSLTGTRYISNVLSLQMTDNTYIPGFVGGVLPASSVDFSAFAYKEIIWSFMVDDFVLHADGQDYSNVGTNVANINGTIESITVSVVPEPGTLALLGILGICLGGYVWRNRWRARA